MTTILTKYPFVGSIDTKQGGRPENQDNAGFVDTPLGLLLVVCDGMGGGPAGRTASLMAVDAVLTALSDVSEHTPREDGLRFAIEKANDIIYAKAKETPELMGMGTTIAAVLINETSAVIAHAGDTRIYQLRKGTIVFRSSDHSVVANMVRQKKLTEEEARNHPQSNIVTRALGIRPNVEIDFNEVSFLRGDRFVICTDGIWGMMPQRDLVKSLSRVMGIGELTALVAEEIDRMGQENGGGHDNLTLAVIDTTFDSEQRGNRKTCVAENGDNSTTKCTGHTVGRWIILTIIVTAVILSLVFVVVYKMFPLQEKKEILSKDENRPEEIINTPPVKPLARDVEENSEEPPMVAFPENVEELINDSLFRIGYDKVVSQRINIVITKLDSLKSLRGKDYKTTKKIKRYYIHNVIKPELDSLYYIVTEKKRPVFFQIIRLLNDNKTVLSSSRGQPTLESNKHIDQIIKTVKQLQD